MTHDEAAFVEEMGQYLASYGMTPMAGRMWGWLLICEPPEQTAAEIAERGLAAMSDESPSGRARLEEFRDVIAFIERELPLVIDRFFSERAGTTGRKAIP